MTPRPASELFPEALQLSSKQREVLDQLQTHPGGARSVDLAKQLGMHVNTVRGHLDELIARGAVRTTTAPAQGRGRPSLIFQVRVPDNRVIAEEYVSLVEVLTDMLIDATSPTALDQAREIGRAWARRMTGTGSASTVPEALDLLMAHLRELGFDPALLSVDGSDNVDIHLQSCPFVTTGGRPSPAVCAMHEGYLQEAVGSAPVTLTLKPFYPAGACTVTSHDASADAG
ncbi:MAG: helix-turn-helix domain-containing protein [Corynebacterium sp.]|uniref:helix-turn-helix transcriptional regulator n=1 Tax=Corynebacterium sp. TaxID=1720 RepID=UPI0026DF389D|nr:helix-turn-helix domain-containing protein [Corynebacterium sp.]MDO5670481.1 helix-turn-helix domain-containing protein [Corynebacterium sp.]